MITQDIYNELTIEAEKIDHVFQQILFTITTTTRLRLYRPTSTCRPFVDVNRIDVATY
jgi:hypothetical protein